MDVSIEQLGGRVPVTVFHIRGDIDIHSYQALETVGREAVGHGARHVLLDLSGVDYVSSAGLRAVHTLYTLLNSGPDVPHDEALSQGLRDGSFKSRHLKLLSPKANVQQVLKTTGFDMFLEIYDDLGEAVASFL
jgi:anti-anti-sigma regulatory factor